MLCTVDDGTEAITEFGTESGTFVHETMTAFDSDLIVINYESGSEETQEIGTITGDVTESGTVTCDGTQAKLLVGTVVSLAVGTLTTFLEETESGTLV